MEQNGQKKPSAGVVELSVPEGFTPEDFLDQFGDVVTSSRAARVLTGQEVGAMLSVHICLDWGANIDQDDFHPQARGKVSMHDYPHGGGVLICTTPDRSITFVLLAEESPKLLGRLFGCRDLAGSEIH